MNIFFNCLHTNKPQHYNLSFLTDTMSPVLSLQIHLRIPIRVKYDNSVSTLQVKSQSSCTCAQKEDIKLRVFFIKTISHLTSIFGSSIKTQMFDSTILEINLHNVHEVGHLGEDQDSVVVNFEFGENSIKELKLSGRPENPVCEANLIVVFQEHIRMVTTLSLLHHQIIQSCVVYLAWVIVNVDSIFFF